MPSCTPPCLLFRPCRNFSDYVGIFPTMWEFFRLCGNFSDHVPFPRRNFSHHVGIFPTMSEFFPIPILYAGKNPLLVDGRAPRSIWCKKTLWVAVKIFLSLLRESSAICKAISRKSAETVSFFLQCSCWRNPLLTELFDTLCFYVKCRVFIPPRKLISCPAECSNQIAT